MNQNIENNPNKEIIKDFHNELKESTSKNENVDSLMEYFSNLENEYKQDLLQNLKR